MNLDLISAIVFYSIVGILIYKYRHKFEIIQKIFIVYKTKKGINLMKKFSKHPFFWKIFSTIAIPVGIFFMLLSGKLLFENLINIVEGRGGPGVGILIPGIKIPGSPFFVPFWPGIISIAILAIVHEFSHGIVATIEGLKPKSTGFGFFAIFPLAFVELDEKKLEKKDTISRLRISSAGPFGNILFWLIISFIISFSFVPFLDKITVYDGLNITKIEEGMPAELAGIKAGETIISINNKSIYHITDFINEMRKIKPGEIVIIKTDRNVYEVKTTENPNDPSKAYLGVTLTQLSHISESAKEKYGYFLPLFLFIFDVLRWSAILNFLVGIMNFLPIWALDGGRIIYDIFGYFIKNKKFLLILVNVIFSFYLTLVVLNIIGPAIF